MTYAAKVCWVSDGFDGVGNGLDRVTGPEAGALVVATMVLEAGRGVGGGVGWMVARGDGDIDAAGVAFGLILSRAFVSAICAPGAASIAFSSRVAGLST